MRNRNFPTFAKIRSGEPTVEAHSRGDQGAGGHYAFAIGGGARVVWNMSIAAMCTPDALEFRAFLHSLRGTGGTFGLKVPGSPVTSGTVGAQSLIVYTDGTTHTDGQPYSDSVVSGAALKGSDSVTVTAPLASLKAGEFALIGSQLVRVVSVSGNNIFIRPRLRADAPAGTAVSFGAVVGTFRLSKSAPPVPLVVGRSLELTLEIEEAY